MGKCVKCQKAEHPCVSPHGLTESGWQLAAAGWVCPRCLPGEPAVPASVSLSGIRYNVRAHENAVLFSGADGCGPCYTRLTFERRAGCWYVAIDSSNGTAMVSHIEQAMRHVEGWFGGNHCLNRG